MSTLTIVSTRVKRSFEIEDFRDKEVDHYREVKYRKVRRVMHAHSMLRTTLGLNHPDYLDTNPVTAERLIKAVDLLNQPHYYECSHLITTLATANGNDNCSYKVRNFVQTPQVRSGDYYAVCIPDDQSESGWQITHSAIGTRAGHLLSIFGCGGDLTIMNPAETLQTWNYDAPRALLAELIPQI